MPHKAGLDSALDFTKFVVTLDGALIAFVTGATFLQTISSGWEKILIVAILIALAVSLAAGIFVYMRAATMLGNGHYQLADPWLAWPGAINVICFAAGAIGVGGLAAFELVLKEPVSKPAIQQVELRCALTDRARALVDCRGRTVSGVKAP